jgi:hypothetical protein
MMDNKAFDIILLKQHSVPFLSIHLFSAVFQGGSGFKKIIM